MYKNAKFRVKVREMNFKISVLKTFMLSSVTDVRTNIFRKKVKKIQNVIKKYLWAVRYEKNKEVMNQAAMKIMSYMRMRKQRRWFLDIRDKTKMVQSNIRTFLLMGHVYKEKVCRSLLGSVLNSAWLTIIDKKALMIQRNWKGYKVRKQFQEIIRRMKIRAFLKRALVKKRVNSFKELLYIYKKPVVKLQSIVRARYMRRVFLKVRKSALIIQKAYRRHLHKRFYLERLWKMYKQNLNEVENQKMK